MGADRDWAGLRAGRAGALSVVTLVLAGGAHLVGGGALPGLPALAGLLIPIGCAALLLTRTRVGLAGLLAWLAAAQAGTHVGLAVLSAPVSVVPHWHRAGAGILPIEPTAALTGHQHVLPDAPMLAAHLAATVLTAMALAVGERLIWLLHDLWARRSQPAQPIPAPICLRITPIPPPAPVAPCRARRPDPRGPPVAWLLAVS